MLTGARGLAKQSWIDKIFLFFGGILVVSE
jgi:hypothetical protein